jgi:CHASE2 domain-containing sensor protein
MAELKLYSKRRLFLLGLAIGIGVTMAMLILFVLGTFDFLENRLIDGRFLIRGEIETDPRIVIVSIDESSFSALEEKWPWPRTYFAHLIDRLSREGAKIIGIDVIMSEPYLGDEELARSAKRSGNVVFPSKFEATTRVPERRLHWRSSKGLFKPYPSRATWDTSTFPMTATVSSVVLPPFGLT